MKEISRRSFLGKLACLAAMSLLPISTITKQLKKKPIISTNGHIGIGSGGDIVVGDFVSLGTMNRLSPATSGDSPILGVARREFKSGETLEYYPYGNTKDLFLVGKVPL